MIETYKADVNHADEDGYSVLLTCSQRGSGAMIDVLMGLGADQEWREKQDRWHSAHFASQNGCLGVLRALVERHGTSVNVRDSDGLTPMYLACQRGRLSIVQFLLDHNADLSLGELSGGWKPIHLAAQSDNVDLVRMLLRANPEQVSWTELHGCTPLHVAAANDQVDIVRCLVEEFGADINVMDEDKRTPLIGAAPVCSPEMIVTLLELGADPNVLSNSGFSALHSAAFNDRADATRVLMAVTNKRIVMEHRTQSGYTALSGALYSFSTEAAWALMTHDRAFRPEAHRMAYGITRYAHFGMASLVHWHWRPKDVMLTEFDEEHTSKIRKDNMNLDTMIERLHHFELQLDDSGDDVIDLSRLYPRFDDLNCAAAKIATAYHRARSTARDHLNLHLLDVINDNVLSYLAMPKRPLIRAQVSLRGGSEWIDMLSSRSSPLTHVHVCDHFTTTTLLLLLRSIGRVPKSPHVSVKVWEEITIECARGDGACVLGQAKPLQDLWNQVVRSGAVRQLRISVNRAPDARSLAEWTLRAVRGAPDALCTSVTILLDSGGDLARQPTTDDPVIKMPERSEKYLRSMAPLEHAYRVAFVEFVTDDERAMMTQCGVDLEDNDAVLSFIRTLPAASS
eukprot:TRINITY_DN65723_c9_g9_i3.p1 TRINITY_DN65723_c9_g9~~TRINITY_DN65723_c9_g9_i3.p1  ORF type:complete len:624 (+),score=248.10 TRINITY_DN65723_c9_g9_i3:1283-3154(+)